MAVVVMLIVSKSPEDKHADKPSGREYITDDEFPALIKGGSGYNQMRYMIKIALVADMNGHSDYLKEALFLMCHEGYQTDVFPPIDGTAYLEKDETGKYVFDHLEWTEEGVEEE